MNNMSLMDGRYYKVGSWYGIQGGDPGTAAGDMIYYQWPGGTDHLALQVGWGTDPVSGWQGEYVDAHTSPHYHAFWTLAPYNSAWANTTVSAYHVDSGSWGDVTILSTANNYYVSTEMGYSGGSAYMLRARSASWGGWEQYSFEPQSDGSYAIRSLANNLYVSTELGYSGGDYAELRARSSSIGPWEKYNLISLGGPTYALQSQANGLYVSAELGYTGGNYGELRARASAIGAWEQYGIN